LHRLILLKVSCPSTDRSWRSNDYLQQAHSAS